MRKYVTVLLALLMICGFLSTPITAKTTTEYVKAHTKYEVNLGGAFSVRGLDLDENENSSTYDTYLKMQVKFYDSLESNTSIKETILKRGDSVSSSYGWSIKFIKHDGLFEVELRADEDVYISGSQSTDEGGGIAGEEEVFFLLAPGEKKWVIDDDNQIAIELLSMTTELATFQFYNMSGEKIRYKTMELTDDLDVYSFEFRLIDLDEEVDNCEIRVRSKTGLVTVKDWDEWGEHVDIIEADTKIPVIISPNIPYENEQFVIKLSDPSLFDFADFGVKRVTDMDGIDLEEGYSIDSRNETMILMRFRNKGEYAILLFGEFSNGTLINSWKTITVYEGTVDTTPEEPTGPTQQTDFLWILLNTPGGGAVLLVIILIVGFFMYRWKKPAGPSLEDLQKMTGDTPFMDEIASRYKAPPSERFPSIGTRKIEPKPRSEEERPP